MSSLSLSFRQIVDAMDLFMHNPEKRDSRTGYTLLLIFIFLSACILIGGYLDYVNYKKNYSVAAEKQLSAVADLKVDQLEAWRKERLGDGLVFYKNDEFSTLVKRFIRNRNDRGAKTGILTWVGQVQSANRYDLTMLLDIQLNTILVYPENKERVRLEIDQTNIEILLSGNMAFQDFYRNDKDQRIHLKVLVPILDSHSSNRLVAVLVLRISPEEYLFPLIKKWPTPSRTSETLIIRKDGSDALFLNDPKFHSDAVLNLRIPLAGNDAPAVKAALGQTGIVEGLDYRGVPVIADVRAVPNSPWFIVAKMDMEEMNEPLKERLWMTIILIGALLGTAGAGVGLAWRRQLGRFHREQYKAAETLRNSEERYRRLFEAARDGILILDAETGMITDVNPFLIEMLGYSHEVFLGKKIWELGLFKDIIANREKFLELQLKEYIRYECLPLETINGQTINVEFVSYVYLVNQCKVIQCNIRDITERKRVEEAVLASEARYRSYIDATGQIGWVTNANGEVEEDVPSLRKFSGQTYDGLKPFILTTLSEPCRYGIMLLPQKASMRSNTACADMMVFIRTC
jgi:PAS domain S-box-containing protein